MTLAYREPEPVYREVWDWDVVILHGDVKVIGASAGHLDHCAWETWGAKCSCGEGPRLSSPVVDANGRKLMEGGYKGDETGEARALLGLDDGSLVPVMSGKTYRLCGPRRWQGHDSFALSSIWRVYAEPEVEAQNANFWARLLGRVLGRAA